MDLSAYWCSEPSTGLWTRQERHQRLKVGGLDRVAPGIMVFHAGTAVKDGKVCTAGGRVLTVAATGDTVAEARKIVYNNLSGIGFDGCFFRKDIAAEEE